MGESGKIKDMQFKVDFHLKELRQPSHPFWACGFAPHPFGVVCLYRLLF